MTDPPPYPDTGDDTGVRPVRGSPPYPGTPRWVWVFGVIGIVVVLLVVIILFTGVGGPAGHTPPIQHRP